jgi:hypothetical protein
MLMAGLSLLLLACLAAPPATSPPASPIPDATAALISCDEMTPVADHGSILPEFTPAYPCELENVERHVDFCMVHASPTLSYPCSQTESVAEQVIGAGEQTQLIQRDEHVSAGCWHGASSDTRALRRCDTASGASVTLAEDVLGVPISSPDEAWFAFVAAEPGSYRLGPHLFRVRVDGAELLQLDTQPFPQEQVVGAHIVGWSEDGEWLEISLWDGRANGYHRYRLRTDGSGQFEVLP